jgi:GNAT superfamily N-acetyltransferase
MTSPAAASGLARDIVEAYRWQRRLGAAVYAEPFCQIVADPAHPDVWDVNHVDGVVAETDTEFESVFAAMEARLAHAETQVIHTDRFTSDAFLARLALDDFVQRPVTIQMALLGVLAERGPPVSLKPIVGDEDWEALLPLALANHAERQDLVDLGLSAAFSWRMTEVWRKKSPAYTLYLAIEDDTPIAYGGCAAAPGGVGMIEDLFTLPVARGRGVARGIIAALVDRLRRAGCHMVFLGAVAEDWPKRLYSRLGFRPVGLAQTWVREQSVFK